MEESNEDHNSPCGGQIPSENLHKSLQSPVVEAKEVYCSMWLQKSN